jgi:V/A-type H+/Na+-transporting ATPase subunit C
MSELKRYAYINARLRGRLSQLLTDDFFNRLADSENLSAAMAQLKNSRYDFIVSLYEDTGDIRTCENALYVAEVDLYRDLYGKVDKSLQPFIDQLTLYYETDNLKNLLRLWFDRKIRARDINAYTGYIFKEKIQSNLPIDALINAEEITDIISLLNGTPYMAPIARGASETLKKGTLFPIELELDKVYYESLWDSIDTLPRKDWEPARKAIGAQIDLINLNTVVRLKHYFEMEGEKILASLIAGGLRLNRNTLVRELSGGEFHHGALLKRYFPEYAALLNADSAGARDSLTFMETAYDTVMDGESRKALRGYPFSIGVVLAYFHFSKREIARLMLVLNAKFYRLSPERVRGLL